MHKLNINSVNPYIRRANPSILPIGTRILCRAIFDYELIYIENGDLTLKYDGVNYRCKDGQFVLIRPGVPHSFKKLKTELSQPHIHFDISYRENSEAVYISFKNPKEFTTEDRKLIRRDVFADYSSSPLIKINEKDRALSLFYGIIGNESSPLLKKAMLIELLDIIIKNNFPGCFKRNEKTFTTIEEIKGYIDAGQGLNLTLDDLEKQFSYSKYYLEKKFKSKYGVSLIAYRNQKRLETARAMLKYSSVSEVSEKLGYSSIYAFSRAYKLHFGTPPSLEKG